MALCLKTKVSKLFTVASFADRLFQASLEKLDFGCHSRDKDMEAKSSFTLPVTFHCSFYLFTTLVTDFMAAAMGSFSFLSLSRNNDAGGQYFKYDGPVCQRLAPKHLLAV